MEAGVRLPLNMKYYELLSIYQYLNRNQEIAGIIHHWSACNMNDKASDFNFCQDVDMMNRPSTLSLFIDRVALQSREIMYLVAFIGPTVCMCAKCP